MRTFQFAFSLPLFVSLAACGAPDSADFDADESSVDGVDGKADGVDSTYTYYTIRHDTRRCISPLCGGYWVKKVNSSADERYVAELSPTKSSGLSQGDLDGAPLGVVRGYVNTKTFDSFGKLSVFAATEAWLVGDEAATAKGTFYRLTDKNFVCAKAPCFNIGEAKLNSSARDSLSGITGKLASDATSTLLADDTLLVVGSNQTQKYANTSTKGKVVAITQYFTKVKHIDYPTCALVDCAPGSVCEMIDVVCITAPCNPVPQCLLSDDSLVQRAQDYAFPKGSDEYTDYFFKTEADAYAFTNDHADVTWVAFDGANNKFVWGQNDLWYERFEIDRLTGEITTTGEH